MEYLTPIEQAHDSLSENTTGAHVTLEETLQISGNIIDNLVGKLTLIPELEDGDIFDEDWEVDLHKQLLKTYAELSDLESISAGNETREHIEIGIMSAEAALIQDLRLLQLIIENDIRRHLLRENMLEMEQEKIDESPEGKAEYLFSRMMEALFLDKFDKIDKLKEELESLRSQLPENSTIAVIDRVIAECEKERARRTSLHVLDITKKQLQIADRHFKGGFFHNIFPFSPEGKANEALSDTLVIVDEEEKFTVQPARALRYDQPKFRSDPAQDTPENRLILISMIENKIVSGECDSIRGALESLGMEYNYDKPLTPLEMYHLPDSLENFSHYLVECESMSEHQSANRQKLEVSEWYSDRGKYHEKRNILSAGFLDTALLDKPMHFTYTFDEEREINLRISSKQDLDIETERILYAYYPDVIDRYREKAAGYVNVEELTKALRDRIFFEWKKKNPELQKRDLSFIESRKFERILSSCVSRIINTRIEEEAKAILRDEMIQQMVKQNDVYIQTQLDSDFERDALERFKKSAYTQVSEFQMSDDLSHFINDELISGIILMLTVKASIDIPKKITERGFRMAKISTKSGKWNWAFGTVAQVFDNIAFTYLMYGGNVSAGQWITGIGTRIYSEKKYNRMYNEHGVK